MISLENEMSVIQQMFKLLNTVIDAVTFFFTGRPVQLGTLKCFAKVANHLHFTIRDHKYVSTDTIIGSVGLHDWCGCIIEEVQLLTIRYGLLAHLKRTNALRGSFEFAIALICFVRGTHVSKRLA